MENILAFLIGTLQITVLDLALCADNIGIIALATKNLPVEYSRKATIYGISGAIGLRIIFACFMTLLLSISTFPIKLIGGLLLVKITWDFIKPCGDDEECANVKQASKFWEAVGIIIIADMSMSLDNVLAIAGAANGHLWLIVFGIALNIPVLFFGSQFVSNLMKKYRIAIYIGGAVLAHTAFKMIFEDSIVYSRIPHLFGLVFPWLTAVATLVYGIYIVKKSKGAEAYE
ncbi:MAG TPA: TerC family protein [Clostridia bacterium]|nr:TerC family protein [Clostridia bacterium]